MIWDKSTEKLLALLRLANIEFEEVAQVNALAVEKFFNWTEENMPLWLKFGCTRSRGIIRDADIDKQEIKRAEGNRGMSTIHY